MEAEGTFFEVSGEQSFEIAEELSLTNALSMGINQGYLAEGHNGINHIALRSGLDYALSENVTMTIHGVYSLPVNRKRRKHHLLKILRLPVFRAMLV